LAKKCAKREVRGGEAKDQELIKCFPCATNSLVGRNIPHQKNTPSPKRPITKHHNHTPSHNVGQFRLGAGIYSCVDKGPQKERSVDRCLWETVPETSFRLSHMENGILRGCIQVGNRSAPTLKKLKRGKRRSERAWTGGGQKATVRVVGTG